MPDITYLDVRDALERATDHLEMPPDLLDRVRAGGHRRVVRRRTLIGAGLAVAAAGSVAGVRWWPAPSEAQPASGRLDRPTRGDLAGDVDYLHRVREAWRSHVGGELATIGEPHVAWAARTPVGPVALVAQRIRPRLASPVGQIEFGLTGFVEQVGGRPRAGSTETLMTDAVNSPAFLAGPDRTVLVVVDDDRPVDVSTSFRWATNGRPSRTFRSLTFTDGAAVLTVAPQRETITVGLRTGDEPVGLANLSELRNARYEPASTIERKLAGDAAQWDVRSMEGYTDRYGFADPPEVFTWRVSGTMLPDGAPFVVQTLAQGRTVRIFSFLSPEPLCLGTAEIDPAQPPSLHVRLPGGHGFVVADQNASLAYRVRTGGWLPVRGDAALLPAAATEIRVTRNGRPAVVPVPD